MKTNIEYILQVEGQNMLQVHYCSGANRFIHPDGWGDFTPNMTKTQIEYMNNAKMYVWHEHWWRDCFYWLLDDSPFIATLEAHNKFEKRAKI